MPSAVHPCLLFCLLLLVAPHLGSCYGHTSTTYGGRHVIVRSTDHDSRAPSTCAPFPSGGGKLSVTHRLSPCSSFGADLDQGMPTVRATFNSDALRLHALSDSSSKPPLEALLWVSEYHVTVSYGTPQQKLTVGFDTATAGATYLQCKPCGAGDPCDKAFDPSRSSSLAKIPCRSRDCPLKACSGPICTIAVKKKGAILMNATFVIDTLTVDPSTTVNDFRFACMEMGARTTDGSSGVLDLSRDSHSLASRVKLSPTTVAFSYCLPWDPRSTGFLSFGGYRERHGVAYTTLRRNPAHPNLYFVNLVGVSVGGFEIPVPPAVIGGDALVEVQTTFTYLKKDAYTVLRDKFRGWMKQYILLPSSGELDTCYDFTHLKTFAVPIISLQFEGGATLELGIGQMMYFKDRHNVYSVACLAFAPLPAHSPGVAVIGSLAQSQTEVLYDVLGGKLGFSSNSC